MTGDSTDEAAARPALAPWYRMVQEPDRLLLEHGGSLVALEGRAAGVLLPALLPLLDGTRTVGEVVEQLGPPVEPSIRQALDLLDQNGLLLDETAGPPVDGSGATEAARFAAACAAGRVAVSVTRSRLAGARVGVAGSAAAADEVARLLADAGVGQVVRGRLGEAGEEVDLLVAAPDRDETARLRATNERALAHRRPWLQLLPHDGRFAVVGPLFLPGDSACHDCYRMRRAASSDFEDDFDTVEAVPTRGAAPAALAAITAGLTALLAIRWLGTGDPAIPGRAYSIGTRALLELTCHHVLRVPRCDACGIGSAALPSPWFKEIGRDL